jgi:hypothetical protein
MPSDIPPNRAAVKKVLTDPNTFATMIIVVLVDFYGTEFVNWAPQTIREETEADFGIEWPQANFDRLMAGVALVVTDSFYKSLPDFIELCNILAGSPATPGVFDLADAGECAWGITEALLLSPPDDEEPFTEEIRTYIGKVCEMEGIITPPDILRLAIMSGDHKIRVHNEYSDDPEMYGAIWQMEADKTDDINDLVKSRLALLIQQLGNLQLINGQTSEIARRMLTNLNSKPRGGSPL